MLVADVPSWGISTSPAVNVLNQLFHLRGVRIPIFKVKSNWELYKDKKIHKCQIRQNWHFWSDLKLAYLAGSYKNVDMEVLRIELQVSSDNENQQYFRMNLSLFILKA